MHVFQGTPIIMEKIVLFSVCYNIFMTSKSDLIAYKSRWITVNRYIEKERQSASIEMRWKQMNSSYVMAKNLGLSKSDREEIKAYQIWAGLKEKTIIRNRKI